MAALERYFLAMGKRIAGYDRTPSDLTAALEREGVHIDYDEDPALIPDWCRDPERTLVVYTPAVPDTHQGLTWFRNNGFEVVKRAALLGEVTRRSRGLCFAGTHGKTTTSSMAATSCTVQASAATLFWAVCCATTTATSCSRPRVPTRSSRPTSLTAHSTT